MLRILDHAQTFGSALSKSSPTIRGVRSIGLCGIVWD